MLRKYLIAAAIILSSVAAHAQQGAQIGPGQLLANSTAAQRPAAATSISPYFDRALGSTNGMLPYRSGGVWGTISTGTSGAALPLLNGANTWSAAQTFTTPLGIASGGTNCSAASGACLDNITGFSSTGFLTRTGAGTYAFQSTTGGITNANLANSSVTVNGTSISLGASGTVTAAAGTLTGTTLAAGVTASSLTSLGTITSLTATTINGFTLGGTINGNGQQLNNIVIGTTTPLAITGTAITANTSITSPLHYGGSAVGSTHTIAGTSNGSPVNAYVLLQPGTTQFVGINNATPKANLDINANLSTSPALVSASSMLRMQSADGNSSGFEMVAYGTGVQNFMNGAAVGGTAGSPTVSTTNHGMFNISGYGYNGTSIQKGSIIIMRPSSNWSGTNQATAIDFYTTPTGTTALAIGMTVQPSGGLSIGTIVTDPGLGGLQLVGQAFMPNMASDTATTDNSVCIQTGGTGKVLKGTGALGVCLGTSGAQFKTAFAPMAGGLAEIAQLNFQNYRYLKGFGDDGDRMQYGVTAQDVDVVLPDLVHHDSTGVAINFDSGALLFIGLKAVQQLKADNDNLEARITKLENQK